MYSMQGLVNLITMLPHRNSGQYGVSGMDSAMYPYMVFGIQNATYLLGQGASIKEIQHRLRHSTSQVTTDTYAHVTKKLSRKTTAHLDVFDPKSRPQSVPNGKKDAQSL